MIGCELVKLGRLSILTRSEAQDGFVAKYMGDGVLVYFGCSIHVNLKQFIGVSTLLHRFGSRDAESHNPAAFGFNHRDSYCLGMQFGASSKLSG
jgi:hypothetical protein